MTIVYDIRYRKTYLYEFFSLERIMSTQIGNMGVWEWKMLVEFKMKPKRTYHVFLNIFLKNGKRVIIKKIKKTAAWLSVDFKSF